jgi:hypothetical protein
MGPFVLLDDASTDQVNFAQAIEALATGDPKRVRAADPEWRKRHACNHPPCYLSEGWSTDHFDGYTFLWSGMILGKVMTTDQDGGCPPSAPLGQFEGFQLGRISGSS